jgi:aspartate racemase
MKLLGLIGGMSWESTIEYYRIINKLVKNRLGDWNSAKILLYSVNFQEILPLQNKNKWNRIADIMTNICKKFQSVGCSAIVICSNTMHKIADIVEKRIEIPIINVIDETGKILNKLNVKTAGLLGTKFTMEGEFYITRLKKKYSLKVIIPEKSERDYIHDKIYNEFAKGNFLDETKKKFLKIINDLKKRGTEAIIIGCTEIPMLIKPQDVDITLIDTLKVHIQAAVDFALS